MSRALAGSLVLAAAVLGGCFADAPADDTEDEDIGALASYEVEEAAFEIADGTLRDSFRLPDDLLGSAEPVVLTGRLIGAEAAVSGPMGHGTCRVGLGDGGLECTLALFDDDPHGVLRLSIE